MNGTLHFIPFLLSVSGPQHNKTVVCYISTWAVYRPDRGSFNIDNFDPNLCTIAIYAFAGLDPVNDAIRSLGEFIGLIRFCVLLITTSDGLLLRMGTPLDTRCFQDKYVECHYFLITISAMYLYQRLLPTFV
ncbi:CLUMA_CG009814, isoform A [Clunio marinus]|uniref:CLUMA_CG009814, isoform A n=1 Tax=Clunio marinus TaxID=568069 RepID=A0A1J1I7Z2_9DIPT|nr:CLUMA_CG009814, isoform A [Clunio marinus]